MSGQINGSFGVIVAGKDRLVVTDQPTDGGIEPGQMRDQPATSTARWMFEQAARAHGFDPKAVPKGSPQDEQVTRTLTDALGRLSEQPRGKAGVASGVEAMCGVIRDAAREGAVASGSETAGPQAGLSATATSSRTAGLSAEQTGSKMGAGSVTGQQIPEPADLVKRQQETCTTDPAIAAALGDPAVKAALSDARGRAAASGNEYGFEYGRSIFGGRGVTSIYSGDSGQMEVQSHFSSTLQGVWYREIQFHIHPNPTGPGLSGGPLSDFALVRGGWRVVAMTESGAMYCGAPR